MKIYFINNSGNRKFFIVSLTLTCRNIPDERRAFWFVAGFWKAGVQIRAFWRKKTGSEALYIGWREIFLINEYLDLFYSSEVFILSNVENLPSFVIQCPGSEFGQTPKPFCKCVVRVNPNHIRVDGFLYLLIKKIEKSKHIYNNIN